MIFSEAIPRNLFIKKQNPSHLMKPTLLIALTVSVGLLVQCHPYSGTGSKTKVVSITYGSHYRTVTKSQDPSKIEGFGAGVIATQVATYLVGYIFTEAGKQVKKVRDGKFGDRGAPLYSTPDFPNGGYLLILRTVADPDNKYQHVATVNDLLAGKRDTAGGALRHQILENTQGSNQSRLGASELQQAIKKSTSGKEISETDKVGFLAICPIISLSGKPAGADNVYGIGLAGIYFPLLNGLRFNGEETSLARRVAKSSEVMDLEIYGPNGSGFTTGVAKIPLVWSPPSRGESPRWITGGEIFGSLIDDEQKEQLKQILSEDLNGRLKGRQAFVAPSRGIRPLLRADFQVLEGGETTGWILKGLEKAKESVVKQVR